MTSIARARPTRPAPPGTPGFAGCSMLSNDPALHALRIWLDSWTGIGHVAPGMQRQGYDLQLTQYDERGWRATVYSFVGESSLRRPPVAPLAPHQPAPARDAAHALERGGVGSGPRRVRRALRARSHGIN
jgi:hypothetical protein